MKYKHFILTRFNLKISDFRTSAGFGSALPKEWLKNRFDLFEKYCFPSLQNQTCQNFTWLVFFDCDTPEVYRLRIESLQKQMGNFVPVFLSSGEQPQFSADLNETIVPFLNEEEQYVITTRIDNDDAFHCDMVQEIQRNFLESDDCFLSFVNGLQYDVNRKFLITFRYPDNHFISRIEKRSPMHPLRLVMGADHTKIRSIAPVRYINNPPLKKPMWIEFVHGANVANCTNLGLPLSAVLRYESLFSIALPLSQGATLRYVFAEVPRMFLTKSIALLKRKMGK